MLINKLMMLVTLLLFPILAQANEFQISEYGPIVTKLREIQNGSESQKIQSRMITECPFKSSASGLESLSISALQLQRSAKTPDSEFDYCTDRLNTFNQTVSVSADLKNQIDNMDLNPEELTTQQKEDIAENMNKAKTAATSLTQLMQAGCEFKSGKSDVANIGNRLIGLLDLATTAAIFNPSTSQMTALAAISARLLVALSNWLFDHPSESDLLAAEVSNSKRFINDLCLFRNLAYKYDDLYVDPFEDPQIELSERMSRKDSATKNLNLLKKECTPETNSSLEVLTKFSQDIISATQAPYGQKQCLTLLKSFINVSNNPLRELSDSYECANIQKEATREAKAYCRVYQNIIELSEGDFYEDCESENFQKMVNTKFTSLGDLLFSSLQEQTKNKPKISNDLLQRLKNAEIEERLAIQKYESLKAILEDNPYNRRDSSKSMLSLGRVILGERFDDYTKETLRSAAIDLSSAEKYINDIQKRNRKIEKIKDPSKQALEKRNICNLVNQTRQNLDAAYHSSVGLNDICYVMKGQGKPPLKSNGLNFDNYSSGHKKNFGIGVSQPYLSEKCEKIEKESGKNLKQILEQQSRIKTFRCDL